MATVYAIAPVLDSPWQPERAHQLVEQLVYAFPELIFRIVADVDRIEWQILDVVGYNSEAIERAIRASYPQASITRRPDKPNTPRRQPIYRYVIKYQTMGETFLSPICYARDIGDSDPLAALVQAMSRLQPGEQVIYTLILFGKAEDAYVIGQNHIMRKVYDNIVSLAFPRRIQRYEPGVQRVLESKLQAALYRGLLFIQIDTPEEARFAELVVVDNQMVLFDRKGFNGLRWYDPAVTLRQVTSNQQDLTSSALGIYRQIIQSPGHSADIKDLRSAVGLVLEPGEIAALWHLPHRGFTARGIPWAGKQHVEMPADIAMASEGLRLGTGTYRDQDHPLVLPTSVRTAHMSIIGKTRTGKSNFLHHLIHQDIAEGMGVAVIDPHGDLVRDILQSSIPPHREQDVVVIDIADTDYPPPLNLLGTTRTDKSVTAASAVAEMIAGLYGDMSSIPRAKNTLTNVLATIWQDDNPTLLDVARLFDEPGYRSQLLQNVGIENLRVLQFWKGYEAQSEGEREQLSQPILYRMQALYGNPSLLTITCHPKTVNFGEFVRQKKIILVSLAADDEVIPKSDQELLGTIIVNAFQRGVQNRALDKLFSLYIDEAQRFVATSLPILFAEVGKRGITVTLANQYYKQLAGGTLEAVMGNVGAIVSFRIGSDDARILAPYFSPGFSADDLVQLPNHRAAVWARQTSFSLETDAPIPRNPNAADRETYLRRLSRERYSPLPRSEILEWLKKRYLSTDISPSQNGSPSRYDPE